MPKLFTDDFPLVKNDTELQALIKKYSEYDPYYVASGSIADRRDHFERLYERYHPYADRHFLSEVKKQFHQRTWEMYLGCSLLDRSISFVSKDIGPDILIEESGNKIWIECIACTKGEGEDRVPTLQYGVAQNVPDDEMVMRIVSGLKTKYEKYESYLERGIVSGNDHLIIAVSAGSFDHPEAFPLILHSVFPIGYPTLSFPIDGGEPVNGWTTRPFRTKKNGSQVPTTFFVNGQHTEISGVIYCKNNVLNHSTILGDDILVVHNPQAKNPLPSSGLNSFKQYKPDENGDLHL